jgi:hypothetical protein
MWALVQDGAVTREILNPIVITIDEITHPSVIFSTWSAAEMKAIGLYSMTISTVDENIYDVDYDNPSYDIDADGGAVVKNPGKTEKDIDLIKNTLQVEINERAYTILVQSDWQIVRAYESKLNANTANVGIGQGLLNYRQDVRIVADAKVLEINSLASVNAASSYVTTTGWPSANISPLIAGSDKILDAERDRINIIIKKRLAIFTS